MAKKLEIKVLSSGEPCVTSTSTVDVPSTMGQYNVHLSYFPNTKHYILTVVNFSITLKTHASYGDPDFTLNLQNKGVAKPDAEAIQFIVEEIALPEIKNKLN